MSDILRVEQLKKYFKTPQGMLHAVDNVSFQIERGKTLGVVGESGCGKSTLGQTVLGIYKPTAGKVLFEDREISNPSRREKKELHRDMQLIFQDPYSSLNPHMCVYDLIAEPLKIYKCCKNRDELLEKVFSLMETVGLAKRLAFSYPHELDGGRRQRIGIARALALNPKFIVCDEPVSALDVSIQAQVLNLLMDLQKQIGLTYLFITHDLAVGRHISDHIIVLYLGGVGESCESKRLFQNPLHPYTKGLLSAIPNVDIDAPRHRIVMQGEITSPVEPAPGCRFANRCPYVTDVCRREDPVPQEVEDHHMVACHMI